MVTLCAYDALLTFVLLSQCAIFAEISVDHDERLRLVKYSQVWRLWHLFRRQSEVLGEIVITGRPILYIFI